LLPSHYAGLAFSSHCHGAGISPIHFSACDGQLATHSLENILDAFMHLFNLLLVCSFSFVDSSDDVFGVSLS